MKKYGFLWIPVFLSLIWQGCLPTRLVRSQLDFKTLDTQKNHRSCIKVHTKDGALYVLQVWKLNISQDTISGYGDHFDHNRKKIAHYGNPTMQAKEGTNLPYEFVIPRDQIVLVESDKLENNLGNMTGLTIVGVPLGILSAYCLLNPKACFGSCPTFYAPRQGEYRLMAEGFSSSILPSLEKSDVDMLYDADDVKDSVSLKLTNEALETHVVRQADLLVFPASPGEKVFAGTKGRFYRTSGWSGPESCRAEEGNCLEKIREKDGMERSSAADARNLATKEEIEITFKNRPGEQLGFVLASRQSLMTTHLFYQVMAYTGRHYGTLVADVENGNQREKNWIENLWRRLGGIEVWQQDDSGDWTKIEMIDEMGPIASDVHLVLLPQVRQKEINLRLKMTKGLWRIDWLALATVMGEESPLRIHPDRVLRGDTPDPETCRNLSQQSSPLNTRPGDKYTLGYKLPPGCSYQLFLETRGYYLEWMREEWLAEENLRKAMFAFQFPGMFLKKAAPAYKKVEPEMEKIFWQSRYEIR